MKLNKIIVSILIFFSLLLSVCNYTIAFPSYVGVKEGDAFIWEHTYDEDVMEDFYEDFFDYYDDIFGDGLDFSSAITISEGLYKGLSLLSEDEEDWFKIKVAKDKNITIIANYTGESFALDLESYDENGDEVGYYKGTSYQENVAIHTKYTGYYYISVELWEDPPIIYDLQVNITDWSGDYFEPNNDFSDAPYLWDDCLYDDDLECSYGNEDYYKIEIEENGPIMISISFNNTQGNLDLYLYNNTYDLVSYSNAIGVDQEIISYAPSYLGYYYLLINNSDSWSTYNNHTYALSLILDQRCYDIGNGLDIDDLVEDITEIQGTKLSILHIKEKSDYVRIRVEKYESKDISREDKWKEGYVETIEVYNPQTDKCYRKWDSFEEIVPKDLDWNKVSDEIEDEYEDYYEDCEITIDVNLFQNGLTIHYDFDHSDMKDWEVYFEYDENGVLALSIAKYDNIEFQRLTLKNYTPLNLRVIIIGAIALGVIAVVTIIFIRKRRGF